MTAGLGAALVAAIVSTLTLLADKVAARRRAAMSDTVEQRRLLSADELEFRRTLLARLEAAELAERRCTADHERTKSELATALLRIERLELELSAWDTRGRPTLADDDSPERQART